MCNPLQLKYFHPDRKISISSYYVSSSGNQLWLTFLSFFLSFFFYKKGFIEMQVMYKITYPFTVHGSMFLVYSQICSTKPSPESILEFGLVKKKKRKPY